MKRFSIVFTVLVLINNIVSIPLLMAQDINNQSVEMADTFRAQGKIYVVILVVAIVFTGLILYAVNTDRKVSKVEKELENLKSSKES